MWVISNMVAFTFDDSEPTRRKFLYMLLIVNTSKSPSSPSPSREETLLTFLDCVQIY